MLNLKSVSFFCDFETYKKRVSNSLILNVLYLGAFKVNNEIFYYKNVLEFLNLVVQITKEHKQKTADLFFYNLSYDITVITAFIFRYKIKITDRTEFITNKKDFISMSFVYKNIKFNFKDLWNFDKTKTLALWLKFLNVDATEQKGSIMYDKWDQCDVLKNEIITKNKHGQIVRINKQDEYKYLANDVKNLDLILYKQIEIWNTLKTIFKVNDKKYKFKSIPGVVYSLLTKNISQKGYHVKLREQVPKEYYIILKHSFTGGYVSYNINNPKYLCKDNEVIKYYDRRSAHPYVLAHKTIPHGKLLLSKPPGQYIKWVFVKIKSWQNKPEYNFLYTNFMPERIIYSNKVFTVCFELWELLNQLVDIEVDEIYFLYQKATNATNKIYQQLYILKDEAPDLFTRSQAKLGLNTPFGKLGEKSYDINTFLNEEGFIIDEYIEDFDDYKTNTAGIYIAQISRLILLKTIKDLTDHNYTVLYCDTDSITFIAHDNNYINFLNIGDKIGDWKHEGDFTEFYNSLKNKNYLLYNKITGGISYASGGIPKRFLKPLNINQLKEIYDYNNNVKIKNASVGGVYNVYGQPILSDKDVETNNNKEVTHYLQQGGKLWKREVKNIILTNQKI